MQRLHKSRLFYFLGLLAILLVYSAYNLYVLDPDVYATMTRGTRHGYKFGSVVLIYGIGWRVLRKPWPGWINQLWHLLYAGGLALLLLLAACDVLIGALSVPLRSLVSSFHEFLISPIPYVIAGLLSRIVKPPARGPQ
jgi:hypothetical protein